MTPEEFKKHYCNTAILAIECCEQVHKEGLMALEEIIDQEKEKDRDIFHYGLRLVLDSEDPKLIDKILSNLVEQEEDKAMRTLQTIKKEAVLGIREGLKPYTLYSLLASYTCFPLDTIRLFQRENFYKYVALEEGEIIERNQRDTTTN
jgi:flagellar motor component MotA